MLFVARTFLVIQDHATDRPTAYAYKITLFILFKLKKGNKTMLLICKYKQIFKNEILFFLHNNGE